VFWKKYFELSKIGFKSILKIQNKILFLFLYVDGWQQALWFRVFSESDNHNSVILNLSYISKIFEIKLWFEMGRYEFRSFSVDFLSWGQTMACFRDSRKTSSCRVALTIVAIVSANDGIKRFTNHMGTGSSEQWFKEAWLTISHEALFTGPCT